MTKIKAIDLFSGCGGVSCGLIKAGFNVVGAVEINKDAAEVYKSYKRFKKTKLCIEDICKLSGAELKNKFELKEDEVFLLAGCPPCQNFSSQNRQGKYKSKEEKSILLFEYLRIISEMKPDLILMENVAGIKQGINKEILNSFLLKLGELGYYFTYDILNSADYGVPQSRKRFVLHGIKEELLSKFDIKHKEFKLPKPTHNKEGSNYLKKWLTVWESIGDLPAIKAGECLESEKIKNHRCAALSDLNKKRIKTIRENGGSRNGLPESLILNCHKNYKGHSDVYGIMDPNKPAPTMTGGCLNYTKGRYGHPYQDRAISIREAARIQTFPDDFIFSNSITKSSLEIGNAVPVKLVEASGKELLKIITLIANKKVVKI